MENGINSASQTKKPTFLFKQGNFSYHVVTKEYRDEGLVVTARAFCSSPVGEMQISFLDWLEYVDIGMDECATNGLSVMARDDVSGRIAGILLAANKCAKFYEECGRVYSAGDKAISPLYQLENQGEAEVKRLKPEIKGGETTVYCHMLAVLPEFRANKIANDLIKGALPLAKKAGYQFYYAIGNSPLTSKVMAFHNFENICESEPKDFEWKGMPVKCFTENSWVHWLKKL